MFLHAVKTLIRLGGRAATIHSPHDTIRIAILTSRYDTYRDTLFRLEIISKRMRILLWCSTMVFTILQSLFEMVWFGLISVLRPFNTF